MKQVEAFEEIDAPPEAVWKVLLEFDAYPEWNPLSGRLEELRIEIEPRGIRLESSRSGPSVETEVLVAQKNRRLAWVVRLPVPFTFDAYHEFRLEPVGSERFEGARPSLEDSPDGGERPQSEPGARADERTQVLQRETFRGVLVPMLLEEQQVERGLRRMNEAIKYRTERRVGVTA